jgi:hypothetical protein
MPELNGDNDYIFLLKSLGLPESLIPSVVTAMLNPRFTSHCLLLPARVFQWALTPFGLPS